MDRKSETDGSSKNSLEGITAISVSGYKSLTDECSVEVRPLTVLAGANSSGKSSALQPLLLLKQTLETTYDPGALLINGPNVQFTSAEEQLLSKLGQGQHAETFAINLEVNNDRSLTLIFKGKPSKGIELVQMTYVGKGEQYTLRPDMTAEEIRAVLPKELQEFERVFADLIEEEMDEDESQKGEKGRIEWTIRQSKCFLGFGPRFVKGDDVATLPELSLPRFRPGSSFESYIRDIIHVPGLRGNPARTYKTTSIGPQFIGTFNDYVASIVNHWGGTKKHLLKKLGEDLETLGLTWKVEASQLDDVQVELRVGRLPRSTDDSLGDTVSIADVGFGVSQTLPVLVALLAAKPGQLVYLEQPEIHLHPRAQTAMAQLIAGASRRGVRVVVETHSDLLLLGIQTLVAEGKLAPEIVKLHWFTRLEDGKTQVTSHDLDRAGAFGDWPEDFSETKLQAESRYLDAAEFLESKS